MLPQSNYQSTKYLKFDTTKLIFVCNNLTTVTPTWAIPAPLVLEKALFLVLLVVVQALSTAVLAVALVK